MNERTALLGGDVQARRVNSGERVPHHQKKREWPEDVFRPHKP
jgi:hypothetical protein